MWSVQQYRGEYIAASIAKLTSFTSCPPMQAAAACPDDSERYCHIPAALEQQLMPFQREGIKFALKHGGRALIGDEVRKYNHQRRGTCF